VIEQRLLIVYRSNVDRCHRPPSQGMTSDRPTLPDRAA
jgi:hypothetical protein